MAGRVDDLSYFLQLLPRKDLVELIPRGAKRILDVGCGAGKTGEVLKNEGFEEIYGVEINPLAALEARPHYKELILADVGKDPLPFERHFFDCIVYGDILEHLHDPWEVLRRHREMLKDDGVIICSIPNIRYYKILKSLVFEGRWDYVDLGILDRTHLRFFTLRTIEELFQETGFTIQKVIKKRRCGRVMKWVNRLVFNKLIDFLVIQYRIVGAKARAPSPS
jgi:2-polyprenyl-3-methyl-5-hydroxy-6-metoxy-1,4-benzoquinol methylase